MSTAPMSGHRLWWPWPVTPAADNWSSAASLPLGCRGWRVLLSPPGCLPKVGYNVVLLVFFFFTIYFIPIIWTSTGPIFTKFAELTVDEPSEVTFSIPRRTLPWQPILWATSSWVLFDVTSLAERTYTQIWKCLGCAVCRPISCV